MQQGTEVPPLPPGLAAGAQPDEALLEAQGGAVTQDGPVVAGVGKG